MAATQLWEETKKFKFLSQAIKWMSMMFGDYPSNPYWSILAMNLLGPRDWSPRGKKGMERLNVLRALVPPSFLVPSCELIMYCNLPLVGNIVEKGFGFAVQFPRPYDRLEFIYLCPYDGQIIMTDFMNGAFRLLEQSLLEDEVG